MNNFLIISTGIVLFFVIVLIIGFLRNKNLAYENTREENIFSAKERLKELEASKLNGEISEKDFLQTKADIEISLAQDLSTAGSNGSYSESSNIRKATIIGIFFIIPFTVLAIYKQIGSPKYINVSGPGENIAAKKVEKVPSVRELVKELASRLEKKPNNPQGWAMLGRTYMQIQQYENAVYAFERLNSILPGDPSALLSLADAKSMANGGLISDEALKLISRVLEIEPKSVTALWLSGNAYAERKDNKKAIGYWSQAIPLLSDDPSMQAELKKRITRLEKSNEDMKSSKVNEESENIKLQILLEIEEKLLSEISPDFTVFIYARANSGPKLPLAVKKFKVSELDFPATIYLSDLDAMVPQMKLSLFSDITIGARISKTGQAIAQQGDFISDEIYSKNNSKQTVQLIINKKK